MVITVTITELGWVKGGANAEVSLEKIIKVADFDPDSSVEVGDVLYRACLDVKEKWQK